ncbi:polyprenyl synthetase family protein [Deinococcus peraridilitoris]|nr:polyprenyl synthetase family protein [Deinococcus peraridilitoris]
MAPLQEFESRLRQVLHSRVEFIELIGDNLVAAGGKRSRPALVYLALRALGVEHPQEHDLAVAVELLHSASLLHDDLIDDADTRRGHETAYRKYGNVVSVMSGDFMLSRLLVLLSDMPQGLTREFGETAARICEGEVLQFQVAAYGDYSHQNYLDIIAGKTAVLLRTAARAPALLVGAPEAQFQALSEFGMEFGLAFQMQDDLLDLAADPNTLGKPIGGDLAEGKVTLPVLYLLQGPHGDEVRTIVERRAARPCDIERVRELALQEEAFERTRQEIRRRTLLAIQALRALPPSPARHALEEMAVGAADRVK